MRVLILALLAYIAAVIPFMRRRGEAAGTEPPVADREAGDGDLSARLSEAAITFGAAAKHVSAAYPALQASVSDLSEQCAALALRAEGDAGFARRSRTAIVRLLLPLYGVVRRAGDLSSREITPAAAALLASASALISRAGETMQGIAGRADEAALRHLETDLEILEERLTD